MSVRATIAAPLPRICFLDSPISVTRTEELLAATGLLNDFDKAGLQLLNGWNVAGEDTHLAGLGGDVDLDAIQKN